MRAVVRYLAALVAAAAAVACSSQPALNLGQESPGHECEHAGGYCTQHFTDPCPYVVEAGAGYCGLLSECCGLPSASDAGVD